MCFQVNFKPSYKCIERELESSAKTKASTPLHNSSFAVAPRISPSFWGEFKAKGLRLWYNLHSFIYDQKGEESTSRALIIPFLAIHAKGGENMSPKPKAKGPHHHQFQNFSLSIWFKRSIFKLVS